MTSPVHTITLAPDMLRLKNASKALIRQCGGGEGAAATIGDTRQQRMSDCGNRNTATFLRIDEVARLEDETDGQIGHPAVTRALAKRQGYELVREPDAPPADADMLKLLGQQADMNGRLAKHIIDALADQIWTKAEAADVEAALDEVIALAVAMRAEVRIIKAEGGRG